MKTIMSVFLLVSTALFSGSITLDNQTSYPSKQAKMFVQWASSAKEVDQENKALIYGKKLNPSTIQPILQTGKVTVTLPEKAELFRILVSSKGSKDPDYTTNWIDITQQKTYTLDSDHLVPVVLMNGSGC